jgi:hypothetical protein
MDRLNLFDWLDHRGGWASVLVVATFLLLLLLFVQVALLLPGVLKAVWCWAYAYVLCWLARVLI